MDQDNCHSSSITRLAKHELAAFFTAITDTYGPTQAEISALEWIEELESFGPACELTPRALRMITIVAAARLGIRVNTFS